MLLKAKDWLICSCEEYPQPGLKSNSRLWPFTTSRNSGVFMLAKKTPTRYYSLNVCLGNPLTLFYQGQWNFMLRPSEFTLAATGNLREIFPSWKLLSEASPITDICFYLILLWNIFFSMECHLRCIFYVCKLFVIRTYIYL